MDRELLPGNREAIAAIAAVSGASPSEVGTRFRSAIGGDATRANRQETDSGLRALITRVRLAPLPFDEQRTLIAELTARLADPPTLGRADLLAWQTITRELPVGVADVDRTPVVLPDLPPAQEAAWHAILDLDDGLDAHWCLVGGQLVTFTCVEHGHAIHRPTDDGDIVIGVWTRRDALNRASRLLCDRGFTEDMTYDGYGYRYRCGAASIDLLLPEGIYRQRVVPTTTTGRPGLAVPGGNQALIRTERVPVLLAGSEGRVRRPNLLGALVAKAAAASADSRDTDRHRDDIAVLGRIALTGGHLRRMRAMANGKDRRRLRRALDEMPDAHSSWRLIDEPGEVRAVLMRLSAGP